MFGEALLTCLLALSMVAGAVYAQTTTPPAQKKTTQAKKPPASPPKPDLEPKAIELLKAVSERLAAAHTLSFTAVQLAESPSRQGPPLAYATKTDAILQRPDKLRVITSGDGPASEFYYDGKTMMAYAPAENLLAVADAPPTIDAMLEAAYHSAGIFFNFTDLIVADPYKDMSEGLTLAYYIGQSHVIAGTTTDMVAYIDNGVFIQLWVGTEDKFHAWSAQFFSMIRSVCAAKWSSPTGNSTLPCFLTPSCPRTSPMRNAFRSLTSRLSLSRAIRLRARLRLKRNDPKRNSNEGGKSRDEKGDR